jgi:type VI protein secretion system component Hcp
MNRGGRERSAGRYHDASPNKGVAEMKTLHAAIVLCISLVSQSSVEAASTYLNIPSIPGENPTPGFPGAMAVQSLTITPNTYSVTRTIDSASPGIANAVAAGTHLNTSTVLFYNSTPSGPPDATLSFPNTLATSQQLLVTSEVDSFASTSYAAMFIEIPGIAGPSSTPGHANVIQIDSFSLSGNTFSFIKPVDSASPQLQSAVGAASHFPSIDLLLYISSSLGPQPDAELIFNQDLASAYQLLTGPAAQKDQTTFAFSTVSPEPSSALLLVTASPVLLRRSRRGR